MKDQSGLVINFSARLSEEFYLKEVLITAAQTITYHLRFWNFSPQPPTLTERVEEWGIRIFETERGWEWRAQIPYHVHNSAASMGYGLVSSLEEAKRASEKWIKNMLANSKE